MSSTSYLKVIGNSCETQASSARYARKELFRTASPSSVSQDILTYAQLCSEILNKPCTSGEWGKKWQTVMGNAMDVAWSDLISAKEVQYPDYTPTDALYYLAAERGLERVVLIGSGGILEDEMLHRTRLREAWPIWKLSGSTQGHADEGEWMGVGNLRIVRRKEFSTPPAVGSTYVQAFSRLVWSQFDVVLQHPFNIEPLVWGSGWLWGDGATWGTSLTVAEIQQLRRVVRDHKSAHDTGTYIHIVFAHGAIWGLSVWGSFTWGGSGDPTISVVLGERWWETYGLMT